MLKRKFFIIMTVLIFIFVLLSCKGEPGAAGDKGTTGPAGEAVIMMMFQDGVYPSDGYTGTKDTYIVKGHQEKNYGTCKYLNVSNMYCLFQIYRTLLRFDLSSIVPSNVKVKKAYLELYVKDAVGPIDFVVYELTTNFDEGTNCNLSGSASWTSPTASTTWTTPGGDFNTTAISNIVSNLNNPVVFELNPSVVQKWINDPSQNYGMIIMTYPETYGSSCMGSQFASSEYTNPFERPKLVVYYTLP